MSIKIVRDDDNDDDRLKKSRQARDEAMRRVEHNADEEWRIAAERVLWRLVKSSKFMGHTFTSDDVWDELDRQDVFCREPRALGPMMTRFIKSGAIENIGFEQSHRKSRHAAPIARYRAL